MESPEPLTRDYGGNIVSLPSRVREDARPPTIFIILDVNSCIYEHKEWILLLAIAYWVELSVHEIIKLCQDTYCLNRTAQEKMTYEKIRTNSQNQYTF